MRTSLLLFIAAMVLAAPILAGDDADKKTIKRLLEEIDLVPSLYAKGDDSTNIKSLPAFSATKLKEFALDKQDGFAKQRERYRTKKDKYVKDYPLRASIFEAADEVEKINKAEFVMSFARADLNPKGRAAVLQKQQYLGTTCFKLEQVLTHMKSAEANKKETSKHWLADFDLARTRLEGNLVYLYELNFTLGQIRTDSLPPLAKGESGWRIVPRPKLNVTEGKAKALAKDRLVRLNKMQQEYVGSPWAYFAEQDGKREIGMAWVANR